MRGGCSRRFDMSVCFSGSLSVITVTAAEALEGKAAGLSMGPSDKGGTRSQSS